MTVPSEREQGYAAGVLSERLAQYDKHFADINGSIADTARELAQVRRSLDDLAAAQRAATTLAEAVAAALDKRETAVDARQLTNRGVVAWAAGLLVAAFALAEGVRRWLIGP